MNMQQFFDKLERNSRVAVIFQLGPKLYWVDTYDAYVMETKQWLREQGNPAIAVVRLRDDIKQRNAFYSSDRYKNMTTAEKCAVQGDGFINDYD